jgi:plastocyanin
MLAPAVGAAPKTPPAIAVGMGDETFARSVQTIHRGERLTLANNSRFIHVIGPGRGGQVVNPSSGVPVAGLRLMQTDGVYTTGPWETPGSYYLTCSVHPRMTLNVVVAP